MLSACWPTELVECEFFGFWSNEASRRNGISLHWMTRCSRHSPPAPRLVDSGSVLMIGSKPWRVAQIGKT